MTITCLLLFHRLLISKLEVLSARFMDIVIWSQDIKSRNYTEQGVCQQTKPTTWEVNNTGRYPAGSCIRYNCQMTVAWSVAMVQVPRIRLGLNDYTSWLEMFTRTPSKPCPLGGIPTGWSSCCFCYKPYCQQPSGWILFHFLCFLIIITNILYQVPAQYVTLDYFFSFLSHDKYSQYFLSMWNFHCDQPANMLE